MIVYDQANRPQEPSHHITQPTPGPSPDTNYTQHPSHHIHLTALARISVASSGLLRPARARLAGPAKAPSPIIHPTRARRPHATRRDDAVAVAVASELVMQLQTSSARNRSIGGKVQD